MWRTAVAVLTVLVSRCGDLVSLPWVKEAAAGSSAAELSAVNCVEGLVARLCDVALRNLTVLKVRIKGVIGAGAATAGTGTEKKLSEAPALLATALTFCLVDWVAAYPTLLTPATGEPETTTKLRGTLFLLLQGGLACRQAQSEEAALAAEKAAAAAALPRPVSPAAPSPSATASRVVGIGAGGLQLADQPSPASPAGSIDVSVPTPVASGLVPMSLLPPHFAKACAAMEVGLS